MNEHQFFIAMHLADAYVSALTPVQAEEALKTMERQWHANDQLRELQGFTAEQIYRRLGGAK